MKKPREPRSTVMIQLQMPADTWELIRETVKLDSESSTFEAKERAQLRQALSKVQIVQIYRWNKKENT